MRNILLILLGSMLLVACKKNNDPEESTPLDAFNTYDQKSLIAFWSDSLIYQPYIDLQTSSNQLVNLCIGFNVSPNQNDFEKIQQAWLSLALEVKKIEMIQLGPISDELLFGQLDKWPVDEAAVNNFIANTSAVDSTSLNSQGSLVKGIAVMEYLLFQKDGSTYSNFVSDSKADFRRDYLLALAKNLQGQAKNLVSKWEAYSPAFKNATGRAVTSAITKVVNSLAAGIDVVKNKKLARPLGLIDGFQKPEESEGVYSSSGKGFILENLHHLERFMGDDKQGLYALLNAVDKAKGQELMSTKIKTQLDKAINSANALNGSVDEAIANEQEKVLQLYNDLKTLLMTFKGQAIPDLGIQILFSDADGD